MIAPSAQAQIQGTLDLGAATVSYNDSARVTATTLTPRIRFDRGAFAGSGIGTLSSMTQGRWTIQGSLDASLLSAAFGRTRFEVAGEAGGSVHDDATRTGQYLGRARLHIGGGTRGLWAGAAGGRTWDALVWQPIVQGDFGAWSRTGQVQLVAIITPSAIGDSLRYTDAQGAVRWDGHRLELTAGIGARSGDAVVRESAMVWGGVSTTLWLTRRVGLVAAGGTYPVDFTQGYPGGGYFSVAFRLGERSIGSANDARHADRQAVRHSAPLAPRMEVATMHNGQRRIRFHVPGARNVEVMGDFTQWQALGLSPAPDGWWTTAIVIAPGMYQLNVRVNGGQWDVPAGVPVTEDEFGTRVGVLVLH